MDLEGYCWWLHHWILLVVHWTGILFVPRCLLLVLPEKLLVQSGGKYLPFDHFRQGLGSVGGCCESQLLEDNPSNHSQNHFHFHMRLDGNLCADQNIVEAMDSSAIVLGMVR
jgi:hypothetical protein